jgi:hypothetical protein
VIELRKESYRPKTLEKRFEAGAAVQLTAAEVALEKLQGTIRIKVTPADARLTISRSGEAPKPVAGASITLPEGSYTLTAHAANYTDRSLAITLAAGETRNVELTLEHVQARVQAPAARGMADWDEPDAWKQEGQWYVRKGGNFVGFKPSVVNGTFVFTVDLRKGRRLQWVAGRVDPRNYALFQMDKKYFYRLQVVNGKEKELQRVPHALERQNVFTLQIDVSSSGVVHKLQMDGKWTPLDDWQEPARAFSNGKFGFLLPGGDTIALSNFSFTPR